MNFSAVLSDIMNVEEHFCAILSVLMDENKKASAISDRGLI
ncbi:hypothetical protein [Jiulongibacter sediminis]|nr:hypothetical protein [Jiulongibacter sediminis]